VLRWPGVAARPWAEKALADLCASPEVLAVVLFGSAVRPAGSSFDLDCLYIYREDRPEFPAAPMQVDVRAYPAGQVDQLIAGGHDLLVWCIRLGKLVCERDAYWTTLKERWQARLPFPSPDVADSRAEAAERLLADLREIGDEDAAVEQLVAATTHRARAALLRAGIFPASRPELPSQLRQIGEARLADALAEAMVEREHLANALTGASVQRRGDAA
jgi:hypothetical protein